MRTCSVRPGRATSAKARANSASPTDVASARPSVANTVGRPRRRSAASSTSSWTSVAEWMSSTATAARTSASVSRGVVAGGEEDEQRAQPLAAGGDRVAGRHREGGAGVGGDGGQARLDRRHQLGDVRADRLGDPGHGRRAHAAGTVPECRAMIPPAVRIQRTSVSPAPAIAAPRPSGPGKRRTDAGRYS